MEGNEWNLWKMKRMDSTIKSTRANEDLRISPISTRLTKVLFKFLRFDSKNKEIKKDGEDRRETHIIFKREK